MVWKDIEEVVSANPPNAKEKQEVLENLAKRAKARFLADENFPPAAMSMIRSKGAKVVTAYEAGLLGHPDENYRAHALKNGLVLVTCDKDYLGEKRHPLIHCPAIFVFDFGSGSASEMRKSLRCLDAVLRMPQFFDKWWKVDAKRDSWTEHVRHQDGTTSRTRLRLWRGKVQEWIEKS